MPIISTLVILAIMGFSLWALNAYVPMARSVKTIITLVVGAVMVLWLLQGFGIIGPIRMR